MRFWRIYHRQYTDPLSGEGARRYGGRWNSKGIPALYLSDSPALAMLEVLARAPGLQRAGDFVAAEFEIDGRRIPLFTPADLPHGWDAEPAADASRQFGAARFAQGLLGFRVPSVIVPLQYNAVIWTEHPQFGEAVQLQRTQIPFPFDKRLLRDK